LLGLFRGRDDRLGRGLETEIVGRTELADFAASSIKPLDKGAFNGYIGVDIA
jgi:hypothetical protein